MQAPAGHSIRQLSAEDVPLLEALLPVFGEAFEDAHTYGGKRPAGTYLRKLLASEAFIALVAQTDGQVVGGLVGYELRTRDSARGPSGFFQAFLCSGPIVHE